MKCNRCQFWVNDLGLGLAWGACQRKSPRIVDTIVAYRLANNSDILEAIRFATRHPITEEEDGCADGKKVANNKSTSRSKS